MQPYPSEVAPLSFSSYVKFLSISSLWALLWVVFNLFPQVSSGRDLPTLWWHAVVASIVYTASVFLELAVVVFLMNEGVGQKAFRSAAIVCGVVSVLYGTMNLCFRLALDIPLAHSNNDYPIGQLDFISSSTTLIFLTISSLMFSIFFLVTCYVVNRPSRSYEYPHVATGRARRRQQRGSKTVTTTHTTNNHAKPPSQAQAANSSSLPASTSQPPLDESTASTPLISPDLVPTIVSISPAHVGTSNSNKVSNPVGGGGVAVDSSYQSDESWLKAIPKRYSNDEETMTTTSTGTLMDSHSLRTDTIREVDSRTPSPNPLEGDTVIGGTFVQLPPSSTFPKRNSVVWYSLFLAFYYTLKTTGEILLYYEQEFGICCLDGGILLYMLVYAFLLYWTLVQDSRYWHDMIGAVEVVHESTHLLGEEDEEGEHGEGQAYQVGENRNGRRRGGTGGGDGDVEGRRSYRPIGSIGDKDDQRLTESSSGRATPRAHSSSNLVLPSSDRKGWRGGGGGLGSSYSSRNHIVLDTSFDLDESSDRFSNTFTANTNSILSSPHRKSSSSASHHARGGSFLERGLIIPPTQLVVLRNLQIPEAPIHTTTTNGTPAGGTNVRRRNGGGGGGGASNRPSPLSTPALSRSGSGSDRASLSIGLTNSNGNSSSAGGGGNGSGNVNKWSLSHMSSRVNAGLRVVTGGSWSDRRCDLILGRRGTMLIGIKQYTLPSLTPDFLRRDFHNFLRLVPMGSWLGQTRLIHPNLSQPLGITFDPPCVSFVFEYGGRGTLYEALHPNGPTLTTTSASNGTVGNNGAIAIHIPSGQPLPQPSTTNNNGTAVGVVGNIVPASPASGYQSLSNGTSLASSNSVSIGILSPSSSSSAGSSNSFDFLSPNGTRMLRSISSASSSSAQQQLQHQQVGGPSILPLLHLYKVSLQIARAMAHLQGWKDYEAHPLNLVPSNILITEACDILLCDLDSGLGSVGPNSSSARKRASCPFPAWAAPEVLACSGSPTRSAGVHSFGVILWQLLTWSYPCVRVPVDMASGVGGGGGVANLEPSRSHSHESRSTSSQSFSTSGGGGTSMTSTTSKHTKRSMASGHQHVPRPSIILKRVAVEGDATPSQLPSSSTAPTASSHLIAGSSSIVSSTGSTPPTLSPPLHRVTPAELVSPDSRLIDVGGDLSPPSSPGGSSRPDSPSNLHEIDSDNDSDDDADVDDDAPPELHYVTVPLSDLKTCQRYVLGGVRPPIPLGCPPVVARLLEQCWDENPEERPTFELVVEYIETQCRETMETMQLPLSIDNNTIDPYAAYYA